MLKLLDIVESKGAEIAKLAGFSDMAGVKKRLLNNGVFDAVLETLMEMVVLDPGSRKGINILFSWVKAGNSSKPLRLWLKKEISDTELVNRLMRLLRLLSDT